MTISTNPEDIDSPEIILHYMDSYLASGQNRAAAKLIRKLLATAPLIAVSDAAIMKLIDAQYLNGAIRLTWVNNSGERVLTDVCKRFTTGILEAAGQVAPQATATDEKIDALAQEYDCAKLLRAAPARPRATPPTSKVTEKSALSEIQDQLTRMLHTAAVLTDAEFVTGYQIKTGALHSILGTMQGAGFPVEVPLPQNTVATSKADTGEAIRNATLEESAKECEMQLAYTECPERAQYCADSIRALKSATPSTIKAEPTASAHISAILDLALVRMSRARRLLTNGNPSPACNWGMLDISDLVAARAAVLPQVGEAKTETLFDKYCDCCKKPGHNGSECWSAHSVNLPEDAKPVAAHIAPAGLAEEKAVAPEGWKLMPIEPDDAMQSAGAQAVRMDTTVINKIWTGNAVYRAMVAAAPVAQALPVVAEKDAVLSALERVCTHKPRTHDQINTDWDNARTVLAAARQGEKA